VQQGGLDRLDLVVSLSPLGKSPAVPRLEHRLSVLEAVASSRPWMRVRVGQHQLISALAEGYDAVVMGADKWRQVNDPSWYESPSERDRAVAALPRILLAPRPGGEGAIPDGCQMLCLGPALGQVSSSAVRGGRTDWMCPEAVAFDQETGAWSDPGRYLRRFGNE
jgi:hypothetical protein